MNKSAKHEPLVSFIMAINPEKWYVQKFKPLFRYNFARPPVPKYPFGKEDFTGPEIVFHSRPCCILVSPQNTR